MHLRNCWTTRQCLTRPVRCPIFQCRSVRMTLATSILVCPVALADALSRCVVIRGRSCRPECVQRETDGVEGRRAWHILIGRLARRSVRRPPLDVHAARLPFHVQNRRAPDFGNTLLQSCSDASCLPGSRCLVTASVNVPAQGARFPPPDGQGFRGSLPPLQREFADFALPCRCAWFRTRRSARKATIGSRPLVTAVTEAQAPMSTTTRPLTLPFRISAPNCGKSSKLAI